MNTFSNLIGILFIVFLIWQLYRGIKHNPEAFSKANLSKSTSTMGVLAVLLIGVIWLTVLMLR